MGRVWIYSPLSSSPQRSIAMDDGQPLLDVAAPRSTATRRPPRAKKIIKKVLPVLRRRYRKLRAAEPVPYEQLVNSPSTSPEKKLDKAEKEEKNKMEQQQPIKENTSLTPEKQAKKKDKVKQKDAKKKEKINKQNEDPDFNTGPGPSSRKDTQSRRNKILEGVLGFFTHKIKKHKYTSNVSKNISKVAEKSSIPQPARTSQAPSSNLEVPSPVKICGHSRRTILKRTSPLDKFRPLDALANGLTLLNERDKIGAEFELVMQKEIKSIRKFLKLPPEELPIVDTNISLCHDNERASTSTRPEISNNTAHTSEMSTQTQIYLVENETSNFDVGDASIFCSQLKLVWISKKTKTGIQEEAPGTSATRSTSDLSPLSPGPDEDDKQNDQGAGSCSLDPFSGGSSRTAPDGYRRVQFDQDDDDTTDSEEASGNSRYYDRHLHYKSRKYSLQEGPRFGGMSGSGERRVSVAPGEETLPEVDLDDLATHRTDDPHVGRHKTDKPSTVHVTRKDGGDKLQNILSEGTYKKIYDHSPHSVFVQLDELLCNPEGESEWQERARWIKYEEDREEGSDRWGKPHVASLSFHSLLNLRRCLETGVVLLDLDEKDLPGVAYRVVENMVSSQLIEEDDKPVVMRSLLLRHRHVHEDKGFRFSISGRKHASYTSLQNLSERRRRSSHALPTERKKSSSAAMDMKEVEYLASTIIDGSQDELRKGHNESIMKRIPEDSEATTVLVGAVGFLEQPTIAFVRLAQGILMPSITEVPIPVRFMFILLGPSDADLDYHEVGRSISTLMSNPSFHSIAYKADDRRELLSGINEFLDDSIVLPPGDWERQALLPFDELKAKSDQIRKRKRDAIEKKRAASITEKSPSDEKKALLEAEKGSPPPKEPDDPLSRSGRLFGGVIRDIKRRYPFYVSDFTDALNGQCAAATIFMYFAALSSAITFGGLLAEKTHGQIGISETLVFTCAGGIIFALLAGQPMMITGATGPLLLLDDALSSFCRSYGFDFLAARMYCGLWMIVIALAVASIEGSVAVKKITRFTEDIFAFLISLIFIGEPITNIISVYRNHPLGVDYCAFQNQTLNDTVPEVNGTLGNTTSVMMTPQLPILPRPNTALFCTILTLSTFIIAYYLRIFRNGKFLGRSARRALGDFGVPIAIVLMVGVSSLVPVWTETLRVPAGLSPTAARSWLVPLNPGLETIPFWAMLVMALPALMVYIIVFMETHIAELIIDKPERRLKKGSGFHMDIVIMSLVNGVCGMFGAPWQCVATVRSVSHVSALTVMSTTHAPGDKPHIVEVKEQRLTGLLVAFLCGISVLAAGWLRLVPMAVLFGVFLYMGISALGGIQFWDRCILLLKPVKHHPQVPYVRRVPTLKMHMYTLIQLAGICILYAVKSSRFSLALPFFLVMMVPLRMSLVYLFTPLQLRALDGAQKEIDKDDEPDFYEEAPLP